jgi:hypothetical protein
MSATRVISEVSLQFLLDSGSPITLKNGLRTISRQSVSSYDTDDTIEIPDFLNSAEALVFCGMEAGVAQELYGKWLREQEDVQPGNLGYGDDVIDLAYAYVRSAARDGDALWENDNWDEALRMQGIDDAVRGAIMDTYFKNLRLSRAASEWAIDTLEMCWRYLVGLDAALKKKKEVVDLRSASPDPSVRPSKAKNPNISMKSALNVSKNPNLKLSIDVDVPEHVPGRIMLHKGGDSERLESIFNSDGSLNLTEIRSTPPVDFHPYRYDLYFTKQWDVALHYADFATSRSKRVLESCVMTVAVPTSFFTESCEILGADWKKLIWCSRNGRVVAANDGRLPSELAEYENAGTLIGNISGLSNDQVTRLTDSNDIPVLVTRNGVKGSQVVLQGSTMAARFTTECRGYVWVRKLNSTKAIHFPPPT